MDERVGTAHLASTRYAVLGCGNSLYGAQGASSRLRRCARALSGGGGATLKPPPPEHAAKPAAFLPPVFRTTRALMRNITRASESPRGAEAQR